MNVVLYLDVYFSINFLMDLTAILLSAYVSGEKPRLWRVLLASFLGSLVACLGVVFSLDGIVLIIFGVLFFLPMHLLAFGRRGWKRLGKLCLFSFLTLLFLGGAVESLGYYVSGFSGESRVTLFVCLISISLAYGGFSLWQRRLSRHLESAVIPLSLRYRGESEEMYALVDSGSFLKEPESGDPVLLLKAEYSGKFFTSQELSRIRLGQGEKQGLLPIPVRTASGTGLFYAFRPEKAFLWKKRLSSGKREIRCVVALDFSPGGFAGCPCLIPLSVL